MVLRLLTRFLPTNEANGHRREQTRLGARSRCRARSSSRATGLPQLAPEMTAQRTPATHLLNGTGYSNYMYYYSSISCIRKHFLLPNYAHTDTYVYLV